MAWKAKVVAINDNPIPSDTFFISIVFHDDETARSLAPKQYQISAQAFANLGEVRAMLLAECDKLTRWDTIYNMLAPYIGKDV